VWAITVKVAGLPYDVLADDRSILQASNHFLDATGTATIYPTSVNDAPNTTTYQLNDLSGDGTLTSPYLMTEIPGGSVSRATAANENFTFAPSDPHFAEVNAYAHTDEHFRWMLGLGGATYGALPIHIQLHQLIGGTVNNALFTPGNPQTGDPFLIQIGDGDGVVLANLATDWDVPSHESGHYFVYNFLRVTQGESLGVHEGMADLLVFLQKGVKGNPQAACLGESICPQGTHACITKSCLRTGDNDFAYNDANWQAWSAQLWPNPCCGHKHGQVLSGLVWDLVKNHDMSASDAANLTMTAITYFKADSGIRDLMLAILTADKTAFGCRYDAAIRKYMANRNLLTWISDAAPGCDSIPLLSGTGNDTLLAPTESTSSSATRSSKSGFLGLGCGTVGIAYGQASGSDGKQLSYDSDSTSSLWSLSAMLFILASPILVSMTVPQKARVVYRRGRGKR
jgi:hypothetical protein